MRRIATVKFGTRDIRDVSDGQFPVEVWVVEVQRETEKRDERLVGTPRFPHTVERYVRRGCGGICFGWDKWVEIRTPADRQ